MHYKYQSYVTIYLHHKPISSKTMVSSHVANNVFTSSHSFLGVLDEVINKPQMGIPEMFIRSDKEPLIDLSINDKTNPLPTIPIFDFQTLLCAGDNSTELNKLFLACKDWGFFQVCTQSSV
jgi:hypothetical protein